MDDLISRKEAISAILYHTGYKSEEDAERDVGNEESVAVLAALDAIKGLPSSKLDISIPKEGKWIYLDTPTVHGKCSCCGFEAHYYEDDVYGYDYCPNCGARLRENDT